VTERIFAMLGRKDYTRDELDHAESAVSAQLAAYDALAAAVNASSDPKLVAAFADFEPLFCNTMVLALDRYFVHRLRVVTGKDSNPLNEVELLADSLINNGGVLRGNNVIKYVPDQTVVKLAVGDRVALSAAQFTQLSKAFLAEIKAKFV
jgi:hypothetical protein